MTSLSTVHVAIQKYGKATESLMQAFEIYSGDDLQRDGVLQRFEYCIELAWKTLKIVLAYEEYLENPSPRWVIKTSLSQKIISDWLVWQDFLNARNELSHTYDELKSDEIFAFVQKNKELFPELKKKAFMNL